MRNTENTEFDAAAAKRFITMMDTDAKLKEHYLPYVDKILSLINYEPQKIIDIGSGPGITSIILARRFPEATIMGIDSSRYMLSYANKKKNMLHLKNLRFEYCDVRNLSFEDNYFDLAICKGVLKMLPNKELFLKDVYRILMPKRCAFISDLRRNGMSEFEKEAYKMVEEERDRVRRAIERSLSLEEAKQIVEKSGLINNAEFITENYRMMIKLTKF